MNDLITKLTAIKSNKDTNLTVGNIKDNVTILGVTGTVVELKGETKTVKSTNVQQTITPTSGKNGITEITVEPIELETKTITPSTSQQTITPSQNKDGISEVTVSAVTSSIDNNIVAREYKKRCANIRCYW